MEKHHHEQAVRDIVSVGGVVDIDDRTAGQPIVAVNLDRSRVTDAVLKPLQGLSHRHYVILSHASQRRLTPNWPAEVAFLTMEFLLLGEHRQDCRQASLPRLGLLRRLQSPNNGIHIRSV